jgi:RNA polymerase sigma-70 factor (ECF subfamily)
MDSEDKKPTRAEHPTLSSALLDGVQQMNSESWSRLVATFGPIVYRWCRASGVAESDAADVVQNVFASVARGIGSFQRQREKGSFRSWLATITRNKVRDHFRQQAKSAVAEGGTAAWQRLQEQPDELSSTICPEGARNAINQRVLESVRNEFEMTTWTAFWLTAVDGKTAAEASAEVGISMASVYQAKSRVLRRLRQRLAETPD